MVRLLLVANKTLASGEVSRFVRERIAKDDSCQFTLLVPATPQRRQTGIPDGERDRQRGLRRTSIGRDRARGRLGVRAPSAWSTG